MPDTCYDAAVVGAGVGGLAAAIVLARSNRRVVVYDPAPAPGGLAGGFAVGGAAVERFYHHLFRSDHVAAAWIRDLGLGDLLEFLPADMGFYSGGRLYRFGTPGSLLRFAALPLLDRIRLGLRILHISRVPSPEDFEHVTAMDWLRARASTAELRVFWEPLLRAKFGDDRDAISMAWLWARFRARVDGSFGRRERLGYLGGGFQQLADAMAERARSLGVEVVLNCRVAGITVSGGRVSGITTEQHGEVGVEGVVWTPSLVALARAVPELSDAFKAACARVRYHHALVVVAELSQPALPYYWTTIGDASVPFTVAVEHTRLVGTGAYGGRVIVYLGRYIPPGHRLLEAADDEVRDLFLGAAAKAFSPAFTAPLAAHVFRAPAAQPIVPPGWYADRPPLRSGVAGLVAANMAQIYPWDRGINYSLELGEMAGAELETELLGPAAW